MSFPSCYACRHYVIVVLLKRGLRVLETPPMYPLQFHRQFRLCMYPLEPACQWWPGRSRVVVLFPYARGCHHFAPSSYYDCGEVSEMTGLVAQLLIRMLEKEKYRYEADPRTDRGSWSRCWADSKSSATPIDQNPSDRIQQHSLHSLNYYCIRRRF